MDTDIDIYKLAEKRIDQPCVRRADKVRPLGGRRSGLIAHSEFN